MIAYTSLEGASAPRFFSTIRRIARRYSGRLGQHNRPPPPAKTSEVSSPNRTKIMVI
jgi:hypothetical protein